MSRGLLSAWSTTTTTTKTEDGGGGGGDGGGGDGGDGDGGGAVGGWVPGIPLGRMGNGDDMGGACVYLSSRAGSYITGTILPVDGGIVGTARISLSSNL
jgi:NAD(P)-dependent dehydrogenase (short-subunit alcohol dehydrogenase family)